MDESAAAEIQLHESLSEILPHVERLRPHSAPIRQRTEGHELPDALAGFVASARPWSEQPMALSRRTTVALWLLTGTGVAVCTVLVSVLRTPELCRGIACSVATFGGRPLLTLAMAALGTVGLLVTALFTRGLTRLGTRGLWQVVPAAALTFASVIGAVAVLAITMLVVIAGDLAIFLVLGLLTDRS